MQAEFSQHVLSLYEDLIKEEFPDDTEFGISFLADSEEYAETVEPIKRDVGIILPTMSRPSRKNKNLKVISYFDYNENLLDNPIFSEVNRCTLEGHKFLKIITPLFVGDSHDIILAPNRYLTDILYSVKKLRDYKINTSIHAPLIDLPLEELKRDILDFLDNEEFTEYCKKYNIKQKRGFIFAGPPGNGKTLSLSWLKSQALQRKIEFTAYKSAREYMENSDSLPTGHAKKIVVFEEFDTYLQEREIGMVGDKRVESNQVIGSLLQTLDGIEDVSNVVFIFTTNFPQTFDSAIMRPGRIDKVINFDAPPKKSQMKFLETYLSEYDKNVHQVIIESISSKNGHASYAMLKSVVDNIRIKEFWNMQTKEAVITLSLENIKDIISIILTSSNKGVATKNIKESIL